ncbi:Ankyrin repeat and zinc finger domain-containing 1 [Chlorella sorokiniana]|uniref:Ankyrin repeat and zinc finger domain-containing 1 n=1 Tax=Chlorella sorokiniana TaxID=3076 RepID=A0A2P6TRH6_CHLSO|nr:Ankyrin repeat and zinc finger domain-containing 1 [Chlorella sorokiniana]|eukprot:PRW56664.1 Ankyrin repeat and zinc finger domain-containing 1 [Chlorella sorokiniana]
MSGPVALSTLFELPLDQFGVAAGSPEEQELTAAALQQLDLSAAEAGTDASPAAPPAPSGPTCIACGIGVGGAPGFASAEEQRRHFSLDWHRYNVKRRAAGQRPVTEAAFEALVEDEQAEVGSISGSESEDSEDEGERGGSSSSASGPQFAFSGADGRRYGCWRPLVAPDRDRAAGPPPTAEQCLASLRTLRQRGGRWAVIMLRGGHFAAAVFNVDPARVANPRQADKFEALAHKSAHRYVVRAGQGGKQSAKDASGKYARSAGSRLRRYNEAALQRDVAEALAGWQELLSGCDLVFVHAPSSNWQQLFGGEQPLLDRADQRIRRVPFTTRRPTFSETKRIMRILVTLYQLPVLPEVPASAGDQQGGAAAASTEAAGAQQQQQLSAATAEEDAEAAEAAAAAAAAEEEARRKKAEKRARQKAKQKEQRQAEAAANRAAAEEAALQAADDEIGRAAAAVAAMSGRLTAKPAPISSGAAGQGSRRLRVGWAVFLAAAAAVVVAASRRGQRQHRGRQQ